MKKTSAALAVALFVPLFAYAQNIAIVNGKPVPKARMDALINQVQRQGGQKPGPEMEQRVKDEIVLREIFVQEAEKRGLQSTEDFKQQMDLAREGLLIRALFDDERAKNPISDADLKAEYDKVKAQNNEKEYHARHILVEKEADAKSIIAQLKKGAKFEDLAKKMSKDPGSAQKGGDLDWAAPSSYVPEFSAAMTKLEKGKYTETPVKTQFGYHIIKLEDVRQPTFPAFDDVKKQLTQRLEQQRMAKFTEDLKAKTKTDYKFSTN